METIDYKQKSMEQGLYILELEEYIEKLEVRLAEKKGGKKTKVSEPPPIDEFLSYCQGIIPPKKYQLLEYSIKAKYTQWVEDGWIDGNKKPIVIWKTKIANTIPFLKEFNSNGPGNNQNESANDRPFKGRLFTPDPQEVLTQLRGGKES